MKAKKGQLAKSAKNWKKKLHEREAEQRSSHDERKKISIRVGRADALNEIIRQSSHRVKYHQHLNG